jgi:hypothetical protein
MKLFIANGSHSVIDFQYRVPEVKNYRQQNIPIGGQIRISGELNQEDIDLIIEHHTVYGMVHYKEIAKHKYMEIPYIYSVDNFIPSDVIRELIIQNREFNTEKGKSQRQAAAITVNNMIEESLSDTLKNFEFSVVEEQSKDRDPTFSEGVRVTRDKDKGAPQSPDKNPIDLSARRKSMF